MRVHFRLTKRKKERSSIFVIILVTYFGLQIWRGWDVIRLGRFWAEDGSMIWAHALSNNVFSQISYIPPIAGYFDMNANLYILISTFFPKLFAPHVVLILSFATMLLPATFTYFIRLKTITRSAENFLFFSLLFGSGLLSAEAFGNAVNGQTYLGLYSVLMLIFWPDWLSKSKQYFALLVLALAMMSGWYSIILAPLFMLRARAKMASPISKFSRWTPLLFLLLQIYAYVVTDMRNLQWPGRNNFSEKWYMPILNLFLLPGKAFFGDLGTMGYFACLAGTALFLLLILPIKSPNFWRIQSFEVLIKNDLVICMSALLLELTLIGFGQTGRSFGGRYLIVPSGIFFIAIVLLVQNRNYSLSQEKNTFISVGALLLLGLFVFLRLPAPELSCQTPCKSWAEQIQDYESGGNSLIQHWPNNEGVPNFATDLSNPRVRLAPFQATALGLSRLELDN